MKNLRSLILGIFVVSFISIGGISALAQKPEPDTKIDTDEKMDYSYCERPPDLKNETVWISPARAGNNTVTYFLVQPNVRAAVTPYSQIKFLAGDEVQIKACGCVQTGGSGDTWKRYVYPTGPNSERFYHGLVSVPNYNEGKLMLSAFGKTDFMVRIGDLLTAEQSGFRIKFAKAGFLKLGYEDDQWDDNGYWGHDDGTENQCKNIGQATVEVKIKHK